MGAIVALAFALFVAVAGSMGGTPQPTPDPAQPAAGSE